MIKYLKKLLTYNKSEVEDNICKIIISLKSNKEIDLSVQLDIPKLKDSILNKECAEFLHIINSGKLKNQILSLILDQINSKNQSTIEDMLLLLIMLEHKDKESKNTEHQDDSFILPSKAFMRYANTNNQ